MSLPAAAGTFVVIALGLSDFFSCAVGGYDPVSSPSEYGPKSASVSVSPSGEILEGSSVTLTCSTDANPAANYIWYKKGESSFAASGQNFTIKSIQSSDSGQYQCRAQNRLGWKWSPYKTIDVKYGPKRPSVSVSPSGEIKEGSSVTLTCSTDANPAANYTWYKDTHTQLNKVSKHNFSSIKVSDSGQYSCTAQNQWGRSTSEIISIDVQYGPKSPSVSVSPSGEILEGSSVTLTCSTDANPAANYTWYKEGEASPVASGQNFTIKSIQSSDSGQYQCRAQNRLGWKWSAYKTIDVKYGPKRPSVSVSPSCEIKEGSSVTLTCSTDANPAANYTWYKDTHTQLNKVSKHNFSSIKVSDSGQYSCTAQNQWGRSTSEIISIDVQYGPKSPSVSVSPSGEIKEGSSVTLTCSTDANPAANYTWYKEGKGSPVASGQNFTIKSIQSSDSGQYQCRAENRLGWKWSPYKTIDVKYGPKSPSVSVSPSGEIKEGSSVTLTCSTDANPAANYTWYKDTHTQLNKVSKHNFSSIKVSDSGQYSCTAQNQWGRSTSEIISIDVQYGPKRPSVSVSPSGEILEGRSVTLTCSTDANPAATYTWYKEGEASPVASGQNFIISDVRPEHSGNYSCEAQNIRGRQTFTLQLTVGAANTWIMMNIVRLTVVVLMLIPLLVLSVWMRKKKLQSSQTEANEGVEMVELQSRHD